MIRRISALWNDDGSVRIRLPAEFVLESKLLDRVVYATFDSDGTITLTPESKAALVKR